MFNFKKDMPEEFEEEEYEDYEEESFFVSKVMPIITVILAIAIVISIGVIAYKYFNHPKSSAENVSTQPQVVSTPTAAPTVEVTATPTIAPIEESLAEPSEFSSANESVTAKDYVNLRDAPSQEDSTVIVILQNGDIATRIGINENTGWSQLEYNGQTLYCVSSYLTTDISYQNPSSTQKIDEIKTQFIDCSDVVTAKEEVNLRTLPSVTDSDSMIIATLYNGETVTRTGVNNDVGWSRVDYNGQTLYCISSYLTTP